MSRSLDEWVGKSDDTLVPPRVKLRVWDRSQGKCEVCTRKLHNGDRWECDHIIALINGGANAENNLRVCCAWCHKRKSAEDVAQKSFEYKRKSRNAGIKRRKRTIPGRRFNGEAIPSRWK